MFVLRATGWMRMETAGLATSSALTAMAAINFNAQAAIKDSSKLTSKKAVSRPAHEVSTETLRPKPVQQIPS
jgi:hypothetical protein